MFAVPAASALFVDAPGVRAAHMQRALAVPPVDGTQGYPEARAVAAFLGFLVEFLQMDAGGDQAQQYHPGLCHAATLRIDGPDAPHCRVHDSLTSSTLFANPAAAFGRMFSDTFAGIAPGSAGGFIAAQADESAIALVLMRMRTGQAMFLSKKSELPLR